MFRKFLSAVKKSFKWIRRHKYVTVTLVFLAIILVIDKNNMISLIRIKAKRAELTNEIKAMEADSASVQKKLKLYTDGNLNVIEDIAREHGLLKKNEEMYIIKE